MKIGIVGAGIMGRLLAWQLTQQGHHISLFDKGAIHPNCANSPAAAYTAAGMISPISEIESCEPEVIKMGIDGLRSWPKIIERLDADIDFHQKGSLILAHQADQAEYLNFDRYLRSKPEYEARAKFISGAQLRGLEPGCSDAFQKAIYIENESWLSSVALMNVLVEKLMQTGTDIHEHCSITSASPNVIASENTQWKFDWVFDCRGLGGKQAFPNLRGVRGEVIWLHAPEVEIQHLVRLLHPRYRIYIVPRKNNHYIIGATQIESDYSGPITVRSTLELLSAAYSVHSGFAEASVLETRVNCRPALPNNLPRIHYCDGFTAINGLFRHGFLLAPSLSQLALETMKFRDQINGINDPWNIAHYVDLHESKHAALSVE